MTAGMPNTATSLEERLMRARCWATLIRAAVNVQDDIVAEDDISNAVNMLAIQLQEELTIDPPADIANWTPDDKPKRAKRQKGKKAAR